MLRRLATSRDRVVRRPRGRRAAGCGTRWLLLLALRVRAQRRGHRGARLDGLVQVTERELERAEERDDVLQRHEAEVRDANKLAFHLPLATGHDGVVVVTQDADKVPRVDAGGWAERGHGRGGVTLVGEHLQTNGLETAPCGACEIAVATDDGLEALLGHESKRLLQGDEDRHRRGRWSLGLLERGF